MKFNKEDIKKLQLFKQFGKYENEEYKLEEVLSSLKFIQLDSINVISARSQDLVFYSRVKDYKINDYLNLYKNNQASELYLHALSLVPNSSSIKHLLHALKYGKLRENGEVEKYVNQFKTYLNFGNTLSNKKESWSLSDKDIVTNTLWRAGLLKITRNENFKKEFTLEVIEPNTLLTQENLLETIADNLVLISLQNIGLATFSDIKNYFYLKKMEVAESLSRLLSSKQVILAGQFNSEDHYILPQDENILDFSTNFNELNCRFLSPFDNAIRERNRLNRIFDFDYKLESYIAPSKRKFGYFALPILIGNNLIGTIDMKINSKEKVLEVKKITLNSKEQKYYLQDIQDQIEKFKLFTDMEHIVIDGSANII